MNKFDMKKISVGSVCSGIEAASVAFNNLDFKMKWFSEIADFPSRILSEKYPDIKNIGDMSNIPEELSRGTIESVDLICGGTPCQAFSLAGLKQGLKDDRGNLTLKFIDVVEENDAIRKKNNLPKSVVMWENVEGVLSDKTNAFGCLISALLGLSYTIELKKWPLSGAIHGVNRNVAWRVLDAKYFGLPQQRRRLYLLCGGKDFFPENVLFDKFPKDIPRYKNESIQFQKNGHLIEVFRDYSDCLYSAYGTKWNGNAAAYNGSLFVSQNDKIRRLTPLECERLMGFPDDYTNISKSKATGRYQAIGNSWAVPVINFIGVKLEKEIVGYRESIFKELSFPQEHMEFMSGGCVFYKVPVENKNSLNTIFPLEDFNGSTIPNNPVLGDIEEVIDTNADKKFFISPVGCYGILRRAKERGIKINHRLERVLSIVSNTMDPLEIEKKSRIQKRGGFSE